MLSGDVPFAYGPSVPVIRASLRGAGLVLIGNTGNSLVFSVMSRPEIKQPANLKGKKVGVTRLGGSTDWALDAAESRRSRRFWIAYAFDRPTAADQVAEAPGAAGVTFARLKCECSSKSAEYAHTASSSRRRQAHNTLRSMAHGSTRPSL